MAPWKDWITLFEEWMDGVTSPAVLQRWTAISVLAGAIERRVWVNTARSVLFANMYNLLVTSPGGGKSQVIEPAKQLLVDSQRFKLAPDSVTKASLVDTINDAKRVIVVPSNIIEYHSVQIFIGEFGVFCPAHDLEFLSNLNYIYDNPKSYRERRRTGDKRVEVNHPQINMLAGTQPGFLGSILPEEAWSMGLTSRLMMIYSGENVVVDLFVDEQLENGHRRDLVRGLQEISKLMGQMTWTEDSKKAIQDWNKVRCAPGPTHSKLQSYCSRRIIHAIKLCMISAISRSCALEITLEDFHRAQDWMLHAEQLMPDIFREMTQRSDTQVIEELHFFMWRIYVSDKKPIHKTRLVDFLRTRIPVDKVMRVIGIAESANIIARIAGTDDQFIPRPKHEHGVE